MYSLGILGRCVESNFTFSTSNEETGSLGGLSKKPPSDASGCCGKAAIYQYTAGSEYDKLSPEQRAVIMASAVQLDYMLFQNEFPLFMVGSSWSHVSIVLKHPVDVERRPPGVLWLFLLVLLQLLPVVLLRMLHPMRT